VPPLSRNSRLYITQRAYGPAAWKAAWTRARHLRKRRAPALRPTRALTSRTAVTGTGVDAERKLRTHDLSQLFDLLTLRTYEVRGTDWHLRYVEPTTRYFSYWCCFGIESDRRGVRETRRLWLAFSTRPLGRFYRRRAASLLEHGEGLVSIDLARSRLNFFEGAGFAPQADLEPLAPAMLLAYSDRLEEYDRRIRAGERVNLGMGGEGYWLSLMCGIAQFERDGDLEDHNPYFRWTKRALDTGATAPGMRHLIKDEDTLRRRLAPRVAALGTALRERDVRHFRDRPIAWNATPSHTSLADLKLPVFAVSESDQQLCVPMLDGHHRVFVMKLLGIERCSMMTIWVPDLVGETRRLQRVQNYERRIYQYLGGVEVDDPCVSPDGT
jgi:hypothetical protein